MKYHVTYAGPKPCHASKKPCPVGGQHYGSSQEAQAAFEEASKSLLFPSVSSLQGEVKTSVKPMAGGSYFGCSVPEESITPHLEAFRQAVGAEAESMEAAKAARDRGRIYHLTTVTPPEVKAARKSGRSLSKQPEKVTVQFQGVGKAVEGDHEAWFVICRSPEVEAWRRKNELPEKDLHITLGFRGKDVHSQPKGASSRVL